jgi:hypothetical protein
MRLGRIDAQIHVASLPDVMVGGKRHRADDNGINLVALENLDDLLGRRQYGRSRFHESRIFSGWFEPDKEILDG